MFGSTAAINPKSRAVPKFFNKVLLEILHHLVHVRQDNWEVQLSYIEFANNGSRNDAIGMSAFKLTLGQDPRSIIDTVFGGRWTLLKL